MEENWWKSTMNLHLGNLFYNVPCYLEMTHAKYRKAGEFDWNSLSLLFSMPVPDETRDHEQCYSGDGRCCMFSHLPTQFLFLLTNFSWVPSSLLPNLEFSPCSFLLFLSHFPATGTQYPEHTNWSSRGLLWLRVSVHGLVVPSRNRMTKEHGRGKESQSTAVKKQREKGEAKKRIRLTTKAPSDLL